MTVTVAYRELDRFPGVRFGSDGSVWTCWQRQYARGCIGATVVRTNEYHRLHCGIGSRGYRRCKLRDSCGVRKERLVHQLVLEAFHGPKPSAGHQACHNNGDPADNRASNLRWGTGSDNQQDAIKHGTRKTGKDSCARTICLKLTEDQVRTIRRELAAGAVGRRLARKYGVCVQTISNIKNNNGWRWLP